MIGIKKRDYKQLQLNMNQGIKGIYYETKTTG